MIDNHILIVKEWQDQGVELRELDDHILELYKDNILIARFSSTGVTLLSIREEFKDYRRGREVN